jgi:hypothetical protein
VLIHESDELTVHAVHAGRVWLDGGAMFGVVPKPLWSGKTDADDRNRIPLATRCLLVEAGGRRMLVDTGVGTKFSTKPWVGGYPKVGPLWLSRRLLAWTSWTMNNHCTDRNDGLGSRR